jgi:SnoaL-like domain
MSAGASESARFDAEALCRAVEQRDIATMARMFDDNAEILIVDRDHTPSHPMRMHGRAEIDAFLSDVFGREMTHQVDHVVLSDGTISYVERCEYPDGSHVTFSAVADLDNGRIVRQEGVQAWDAVPPAPGYQDFAHPDEVRTFEHGRLELMHTPGGDVGRLVLEPGWRWSDHVKPVAGTDMCQAGHFGYQIAGTLRVQMADGTTFDVMPGQVGGVPPGHDAWVLGDEPVMALDWAGATDYARSSG